MMTPALVGLLTLSMAVLAPDPPGLENVTKREIYDTAVRFQAKERDALIRLEACDLKLKARTATVVQALAMGYDREEPKDEGMRTGEVAGWVTAGVAAGVILGILLAPRLTATTPSVVVAR